MNTSQLRYIININTVRLTYNEHAYNDFMLITKTYPFPYERKMIKENWILLV